MHKKWDQQLFSVWNVFWLQYTAKGIASLWKYLNMPRTQYCFPQCSYPYPIVTELVVYVMKRSSPYVYVNAVNVKVPTIGATSPFTTATIFDAHAL